MHNHYDKRLCNYFSVCYHLSDSEMQVIITHFLDITKAMYRHLSDISFDNNISKIKGIQVAKNIPKPSILLPTIKVLHYS